MGLILNAIDLILHEKREHKLQFKNKNILIMGYQDIYFSKEQINKLMKCYGVKSLHIDSSDKTEVQLIDLFKDLGFDNVDVLDNSDYEGANILFDMNERIKEKSLISKYDFILDWGTIEHVFHAPNYISNVYDLLKLDGYYYGVTPMSGWVEHGFYQFSPVFFRDAFKDKWETIFLKILNFKINSLVDDWHILSYDYKNMHRYAMGGFDNQLYQNYFLFKKKINNNKDNFIQQSHFENRWNNDEKKIQNDEIQNSITINDVSKKETRKDVNINNKRQIKNNIIDLINFFTKKFNYKVSINKINKNIEINEENTFYDDILRKYKDADNLDTSCDSVLNKYREFTINSFKKINIS